MTSTDSAGGYGPEHKAERARAIAQWEAARQWADKYVAELMQHLPAFSLPPARQEQDMTMTRQQLEATVSRQLRAQLGRPGPRVGENPDALIDASRRAILAAVDDWAAGQVAAAVTPPAAGPRTQPWDGDALRVAAAVLRRRSAGRSTFVGDVLIRVLNKTADRYQDSQKGSR